MKNPHCFFCKLFEVSQIFGSVEARRQLPLLLLEIDFTLRIHGLKSPLTMDRWNMPVAWWVIVCITQLSIVCWPSVHSSLVILRMIVLSSLILMSVVSWVVVGVAALWWVSMSLEWWVILPSCWLTDRLQSWLCNLGSVLNFLVGDLYSYLILQLAHLIIDPGCNFPIYDFLDTGTKIKGDFVQVILKFFLTIGFLHFLF